MMFRKLRNRIIIITMAITTAVLVLAGGFIMLFSSTMRPEPVPRMESEYTTFDFNDEALRVYIKTDREEGTIRLLFTLIAVGLITEAAVFLIVSYASQRIVEPVKDSYDKQKMFIANASHELKTPLAVIEANIEALEVDKQNEKWKDNIEYEINHANKLVLDLLQLARMDAGKLEKGVVEQVDLKGEIDKRMEMFRPKFAGKIAFKTSAGVEPIALVRQDALQVLDILLDNATKYGEKKISITLDKNSITVANDGAKISEKDAEKVFDRFYQTDKTKEGSGLGLAIAKALCEKNGWQISCEGGKRMTKFIVHF